MVAAVAVVPPFDIARKETPGLKFKEVRESWMRGERDGMEGKTVAFC